MIQINTDKTILWNERNNVHFSEMIKEGLLRFGDHITRVEVHLSDENGSKRGINDLRCLMEVRVEGKQPIAVTNHSDSIEQSISGAIDKVKASLKTMLNH